MSTNYDILCFLEYFSDRSSVVSSGLRTPANHWQNFFQDSQQLGSADTDSNSIFKYLAFDVSGFGITDATSANSLTVELAATAEIVDITEQAMSADNLILASLYIQTAGASAFNPSGAVLIGRYIGSIEEAAVSDVVVSWTVNPAINRTDPQVPTRKITANMLNKTRPEVP